MSTQVQAQFGSKLSPTKHNRFTCVGCRIKFESGSSQRDHFKTEWHLYNLKRRVCNLEPIDNDSFNAIQAAAPRSDKETEAKIDARVISRETKQSIRAQNSKSQEDGDANDDDNDDEDWEEVEDEALLDEDYNEEEAAEMLARVIESDTCLFCDKKKSNTTDNMRHMNLVHGFFIPEERYLIDLEGMMRYLGFKVGAGATCLWCNKQFSSLHGVRLHMIYKDHCKISYDQERAIEEFKEFYDYSTQEQFKMKPITELVTANTSFRQRQRSGQLAKGMISSNSHSGGKLINRENKALLACQAKSTKKFNAYRAKILLRTGMSNNNTMRSRLRRQNPL